MHQFTIPDLFKSWTSEHIVAV